MNNMLRIVMFKCFCEGWPEFQPAMVLLVLSISLLTPKLLLVTDKSLCLLYNVPEDTES